MGKIIAIAPAGAEYVYKRDSAHVVPVSSAEKIRSALNAAGYRLRSGETWHVYDADACELAACWQRFYIRSGRLYEGTV